MNKHDRLLSQQGGYKKLKSFQVSQLVYDVTIRFCDRYINIRSRTHDQMVQAARSGVQNIAEGSQCAATSKKFEIKLTNVARASLEELKLDYEDYLRQRGFKEWQRENPLRQKLIDQRCKTSSEVAAWVSKIKNETGRSISYSAIAANAALVLIGVANSLLDRQIKSLAEKFETEGGFTEKLYKTRQRRRNQ